MTSHCLMSQIAWWCDTAGLSFHCNHCLMWHSQFLSLLTRGMELMQGMIGKTHWLQHFTHSSKKLCLAMNHWKWGCEELLQPLETSTWLLAARAAASHKNSNFQTISLLQCWFHNIQCHFSPALFQHLKEERHGFDEEPILGPKFWGGSAWKWILTESLVFSQHVHLMLFGGAVLCFEKIKKKRQQASHQLAAKMKRFLPIPPACSPIHWMLMWMPKGTLILRKGQAFFELEGTEDHWGHLTFVLSILKQLNNWRSEWESCCTLQCHH